MNFNRHSDLEGQHAFLSASNYHWLNYTNEKLVRVYTNHLAAMRGTIWHAFAAQCITLGQKLPKSRKTLNQYVNDAIGFKMSPEVVLKYSNNCFGTADAISFREKVLRIHDLKTGETEAKVEQLLIYVAIFCLEYKVKPGEIEIILRIYQYDNYKEWHPTEEDILPIMDKIVTFDKLMTKINEEAA